MQGNKKLLAKKQQDYQGSFIYSFWFWDAIYVTTYNVFGKYKEYGQNLQNEAAEQTLWRMTNSVNAMFNFMWIWM